MFAQIAHLRSQHLFQQHKVGWMMFMILLINVTSFWDIGVGSIVQSSRQEAFLVANDSEEGYLIPVQCGMFSRGTEGQDFIRGRTRVTGTMRVKDVCLYSRPAFDKLYPELIHGSDHSLGHTEQAERAWTHLRHPSVLKTVGQLVGCICALVVIFSVGAYVAYGGLRTDQGFAG